MGVTIKQIAQMVGVSRGTVDRAIHGRGDVNPEVKARIEQVMRETGYRPNTVAKALKTAQTPMTFGVLIPAGNRFYEDAAKGLCEAEEVYAPYGVAIRRMEETELTAVRQAEQLAQLESENVNGIIMTAVDDPVVRQAVNKIAEKIPVITYNSDLTDTRRLCFIGQDHIAAGRASGTLMGKMIRREGTVAVLVGSKHMLAHLERAEGFRQALREQGGNTVLPELYETHESDGRAYSLVKWLVETQCDLAGICVTGGGQAGAGAALAASGKAADIRLACYDTLPETIQHVKDGVADYTIAQDPFLQGYLPVKILYEYLAFGTKPKREKLFTRIDIRVKDNIMDAGYELFTGWNGKR